MAVIEFSAVVSLPSALARRPSAAVIELPLATIVPSAVLSLASRPEISITALAAIALVFEVTLESRLSTVDWSAFVALT